MTQEQQSNPVPCMSCGKDVRLDYPKFAMAAIAGICGECELQAIEAEKETIEVEKEKLAQQIQQKIFESTALDLEAELLKNSQVHPRQMSREKFLEFKREFHK